MRPQRSSGRALRRCWIRQRQAQRRRRTGRCNCGCAASRPRPHHRRRRPTVTSLRRPLLQPPSWSTPHRRPSLRPMLRCVGSGWCPPLLRRPLPSLPCRSRSRMRTPHPTRRCSMPLTCRLPPARSQPRCPPPPPMQSLDGRSLRTALLLPPSPPSPTWTESGTGGATSSLSMWGCRRRSGHRRPRVLSSSHPPRFHRRHRDAAQPPKAAPHTIAWSRSTSLRRREGAGRTALATPVEAVAWGRRRCRAASTATRQSTSQGARLATPLPALPRTTARAPSRRRRRAGKSRR